MNHGIMIVQGWHQVAQKSTMTTLPLSSSKFTVLPFRSFNISFGAGMPFLIALGLLPSSVVVLGVALSLSLSCLTKTAANASAAIRMPMVSTREPPGFAGGGGGTGASGLMSTGSITTPLE